MEVIYYILYTIYYTIYYFYSVIVDYDRNKVDRVVAVVVVFVAAANDD